IHLTLIDLFLFCGFGGGTRGNNGVVVVVVDVVVVMVADLVVVLWRGKGKDINGLTKIPLF
ncbi:hypothetical protein A2U01_0061741, partial [Trifolium medium]|nr:hypothetical protein [Trifolium medium]